MKSWNELPPEARPSLVFEYVVCQSGQGDVWFTLVSKEDWESWDDSEDIVEFLGRIGLSRQAVFFDLTDLLKFVRDNNITVLDSASGCIY